MGWLAPSCFFKFGNYCHYCFGDSWPFEGVGLRALYLAKRVRCQLVGRNDLKILMDPLEFMLAPHSMTDAEYNLWGNGIPYAGWLLDGLDYDEFNITHLMPSFIA